MIITRIPEPSYGGGILLVTLEAPSPSEMIQTQLVFHRYPVLERKDAVIVWFFGATALTEQHEVFLRQQDLPELAEIIRKTPLPE